MEKTLEMLMSDLQQLRKEKEQAIATVNAVSGAIQYVEGKINELSKDPENKEKDKSKKD